MQFPRRLSARTFPMGALCCVPGCCLLCLRPLLFSVVVSLVVVVSVFGLCGVQLCCVLGCRLLRLRPFGTGGAACGKCSFRADFPRGLSPWGPCVAFLVGVFSVFGRCCFQLSFPWLSSSPSSAFAVFSCVVFLVAVFSVSGLLGPAARRVVNAVSAKTFRADFPHEGPVLRSWLLSSLSSAFVVFSCCFPGCRRLRLRPLRCSVVLCSWLPSSPSPAFWDRRRGVW